VHNNERIEIDDAITLAKKYKIYEQLKTLLLFDEGTDKAALKPFDMQMRSLQRSVSPPIDLGKASVKSIGSSTLNPSNIPFDIDNQSTFSR